MVNSKWVGSEITDNEHFRDLNEDLGRWVVGFDFEGMNWVVGFKRESEGSRVD